MSITSHDEIPSEFYKTSSQKHPLTQKMEKYWLRHFSKIFESEQFKNIHKSQHKSEVLSERADSYFEKTFIFEKFCWFVKDALDDIKKDVPLTNLGAFYRMNFANENKFHSEAIDKIEYYDLPVARKAINKYANIVNRLRDKVNSINEGEEYINKYFEDIINEQVVDDELQARMKKLYKNDSSDLWVKSNEIVQEAKQRVEGGNKDLRDYIIKHSENKETFSFINVYRNYKINHNEDTSKIDNLNKLFETRFKLD